MANRGEEYWETDPIHDPNGQTTVALTLNDDFEVDEDQKVQVFHQIGDDDVELVNTSYDPDTNMITFNTTGFSDFIVTTTNNDVEDATVPDGFYDQTMPEDPWGTNDQQGPDNPGQPGDPNQPGEPGQPHNPDEHFAPEYTIKHLGSGYALGWYDHNDRNPEGTFVIKDLGSSVEDDAIIRFENIPADVMINITIDGEDVFIYPNDGDTFGSGRFLRLEDISLPDEDNIVTFSFVAEEGGDDIPHFVIGRTDDGYAIGGEFWDEEANAAVFDAFEPYSAIPDNAEISLSDMFRDSTPVVEIDIAMDGEVQKTLSSDNMDDIFSPGHFVILEGVTEENGRITANFISVWNIRIMSDTDCEFTVLNEEGDPIAPLGAPDDFVYPFVLEGEDEDTFFDLDLVFIERPYETIIRGRNSIITELSGDYTEINPAGDNEVFYPEDDEFGYSEIYVDGMHYEDNMLVISDNITEVDFEMNGLSEEDASEYVLLIYDYDIEPEDIDDETTAFYLAFGEANGYSDLSILKVFDIALVNQDGYVHSVPGGVTITITLSEPLEIEDGYTLVIIHEITGQSREFIDVVYDADALTLSFTTTGFSPFIIAEGKKEETTTTTTPTTAATPAATENKSDTKAEETSNPTPTPTTAPSSGTASTGEKAVSVSATIGLILILSAAAVAVYRKRSSAIGNDED